MHHGIEFSERRKRSIVCGVCAKNTVVGDWIMTGEKHRSRYRKLRKGKGFGGVSLNTKCAEESISEESEIAESSEGESSKTEHEKSARDSDNNDEVEQPVSASRKKMKLHNSGDEISEEETEVMDENSYRLVHLRNLSSVLSSMHRCEGGQYFSKTL